VEEHWDRLGKVTSQDELAVCRKFGLLLPFAAYRDDELWAAIQAKLATAGTPPEANPLDIKTPEWEMFSGAGTSLNGRDFWLTPVDPPVGYADQIEPVGLVEKLREVRAHPPAAGTRGFSRIEPPGEFSDSLALESENRAPLSQRPPTWVPACEVRGEGIFIQFKRLLRLPRRVPLGLFVRLC